MKKLLFLLLLIPLVFVDYGCSDCSTEPNDNDTTGTHVRKPNLYIYPKNDLELTVNINFPKGGTVTESIPEYNSSWNVMVEPNGRINNLYDYLYYECTVPEFAQKEFGWVIKKEKLKEFFKSNLLESGFNQKEINDFIEYWIPELMEFEYYEIYPQYKTTLSTVIDISFSFEPDNFYRLCYLFIGRKDDNLKLKKPKIETALRLDYFAVEWGAILK